jgi:hypothetical protein
VAGAASGDGVAKLRSTGMIVPESGPDFP